MKNTYDKVAFIASNAIWSFIAWFWYNGILFKTVGNYTLFESKLILLLIICTSILFGFFLQYKKRRNGFSVFMNTSIGYGVYTIVAYWSYNPQLVFWIIVFTAVLSFIYAFQLFRKGTVLSHTKTTKVKMFLSGMQAILTCGCIAITGIYTMRITLNSSIAASKISANTETVSADFEVLSLLNEENWKGLSLDDRTSVLQHVANIECTNLGLPHELNVSIMPLENYTSGNYSDNTHSITVSAADIMYNDPMDLVNTICHESYHAYEHRLIDMYEPSSDQYKQLKVFEYATEYQKEFNNYTEYLPELDNYEEYYYQLCEADARDYADVREFEYYVSIYRETC